MEELTWEKYCKQFSKDLYTYESPGRKSYLHTGESPAKTLTFGLRPEGRHRHRD